MSGLGASVSHFMILRTQIEFSFILGLHYLVRNNRHTKAIALIVLPFKVPPDILFHVEHPVLLVISPAFSGCNISDCYCNAESLSHKLQTVQT